MRDYVNMLDLHPSLVGTISTIGGTAIGAPIDIRGFRDVLAILVAGAVAGSGTGATNYLDVKIQQSASATGTGAGWTDVTPGDYNGTFAFSQITFSGTDPKMYMEQKYERIGNGLTGRYIRAHATLSGTVGLGPKFTVAFLLGRPIDSIYMVKGTTQATGNSQFTALL